MGLLVWFCMGLALWHFSVWIPDKFLGGIVGALIAACVGSIAVGVVVQVLRGMSMDQADIGTVVTALPGALAGLAISWIVGARRQDAQA